MLKQLGNPLAVLNIRLTSGYVLDVLGINQQQIELPFENVPDRLPVHAGRLHGNVSHFQPVKPASQLLQVVRHRTKTAVLLVGATALTNQHASADTGLVNIQPATPGVEHLHHLTLLGRAAQER